MTVWQKYLKQKDGENRRGGDFGLHDVWQNRTKLTADHFVKILARASSFLTHFVESLRRLESAPQRQPVIIASNNGEPGIPQGPGTRLPVLRSVAEQPSRQFRPETGVAVPVPKSQSLRVS